MVRGIKAVLPWRLPPFLLKDQIAFVVLRINIRRSMVVYQNVCARVSFTGMKLDFCKEPPWILGITAKSTMELTIPPRVEEYHALPCTARGHFIA
jgi:hypothetical protein